MGRILCVGAQLLRYTLAGEKWLGRSDNLGLTAHLLVLKQRGHILGNQATVLGSGAKAWWTQRQAAKVAEKVEKARLKKVSQPTPRASHGPL